MSFFIRLVRHTSGADSRSPSRVISKDATPADADETNTRLSPMTTGCAAFHDEPRNAEVPVDHPQNSMTTFTSPGSRMSARCHWSSGTRRVMRRDNQPESARVSAAAAPS